jgi:hypothetical protein
MAFPRTKPIPETHHDILVDCSTAPDPEFGDDGK